MSALGAVLLWAAVAGGNTGASTAMLQVMSDGVEVTADDVTKLVGHDRVEGEELLEWLRRLDGGWQEVSEGWGEEDEEGDELVLRCGRGEEEDEPKAYELVFPDPRREHFEGVEVVLDRAATRVALPTAFLGTEWRCDLLSGVAGDVFAGVRQGTRHRVAKALAADGAVPRTERLVGPASKVHSIVVMASGYTAAEQDLWEEDLAKLIDVFTDPPGDEYELTNPMLRYQPLVNLFSVWQPSPESGASNRDTGLVVHNNLNCTYYKGRLLNCDTGLMMDLAELTPAKPRSENLENVVGLVMVNSAKYGGVASGGRFKKAVFYGRGAASTFASIMYHEMGHAWLGLADEYSYGGNGSETGKKRNCISPSLVDNPPWQHLIDAGRVPAKPTLSCTKDNWYRATPSCLMLTLGNHELCPVCREQGALHLYEIPSFSNTFPSCPLEDETVLVEADGEIRLHANAAFVARGNVTLLWELLDPSTGAAVDRLCEGEAACTDIVVEGRTLRMGLNTVRLTVADKTDMVLESQRTPEMTQSRDFTLRVVTKIDKGAPGVRVRKCYCGNERQADCRGGASFFSNGGLSDVPYFSECTNGTCEAHTTAYERDGEGGDPSTPIPTPVPTPIPTPVPTPEPTPLPTPGPTPLPTPVPTPRPTPLPTPVPTPEPTPLPTPGPTPIPTPEPTPLPTPGPTPVPTPLPTPEQSPVPTLSGSTAVPTPVPSEKTPLSTPGPGQTATPLSGEIPSPTSVSLPGATEPTPGEEAEGGGSVWVYVAAGVGAVVGVGACGAAAWYAHKQRTQKRNFSDLYSIMREEGHVPHTQEVHTFPQPQELQPPTADETFIL